MENLEQLANEARSAIAEAEDGSTLEQLRVDYLGKKGQFTALLKGLGRLSAEERPAAGAKSMSQLPPNAEPPRARAMPTMNPLFS